MKRTYQYTHLVTYFTAIHGFAYWWVKEMGQVQTAYGLRPSEWQTWWQAVHIIGSIPLVIVFGHLISTHFIPKLQSKANRKIISGITSLVTLLVLIFSGFLIQVIYETKANNSVVLIHLIMGVVFILFYVIHHIQKKI